MDRDGVIDRFLTIGFKRREELGENTPEGRKPMGRKGIGKLSIFSIAQIAEVYTIQGKERTAFKMDRDVIRTAISGKTQESYKPEELDSSAADPKKGTRIVLSSLSKSLSGMTVEGLKRRVARRFAVIGSKFNFTVAVNGVAIGPEDRAYHHAIQYLWTYDAQTEFVKSCKRLDRVHESRLHAIQAELKESNISLSGWVGTVSSPSQLKDEEGDNLNRLAVFMRGKMAQEDILDRLGNIKDENLEQILEIFQTIDDLELSYYGQIVKLRIGVICTLKDKLKENDKELVLRDYIFDHLWLIDPGWERTKGSEHAETLLKAYLKKNTDALKGAEKKARIDIGYRTTGGKHVIVELKRASVAVPLDDLTKQIRKYRDGAKKILEKTTFKDWPIEIICLVGKPPPEWNDSSGTGQKGVIDSLKAVDARLVFYDQLLTNAQQAYRDYLEEHVKMDKLWEVFKSIDDFAPPKKVVN